MSTRGTITGTLGFSYYGADRWLEEIEKYQPEILAACKQAIDKGERDSGFVRVDKEAFLSSPSDSIDYAVMEKTDRAAVVPFSNLLVRCRLLVIHLGNL